MEKRNGILPHSEELFSTLLEIVRTENKSLGLLSENLSKQYDVLLNQQLKDFFEILEEQRALVWEMQQKEDMRQEELQKYLPNLDNLSLRDVIQMAPEKYRFDLEIQKSKFDGYVEKIETMKNRNQILIQKSLELIQQQMSQFRAFEQKGYNASGKIDTNDVNLISKQI